MTHTKSAPDATDARIGELIKQARTKMGYAQADLGREIGVTFQQIQKYEKGVNKISIPNLYKIAEVLKTDINYFLNEDSVTSALNDCECGVKYNSESCQDNMESSMYKKEVISLVKYFTRIKSKKIRFEKMAEKMGLDDSVVKQAWAEAKVFRGRSYFELYKRYERLYLNTVPTTIGNIERVFKPSGKDAIFDVIKDDLDDAIEALDWTSSPGRWNKAVAKHIRAQVAMWEDDWTTAIEQCEDIFECPSYGMMDSAVECFSGADLNCKENLYVYQFSGNLGGGNSVGSDGEVLGHRMSLITTSQYFKTGGLTYSAEYGGYGWGRFYPNSYLLSLYDQDKDNRYEELFRHKWYYNDAMTLPDGKNLGDEVVPSTGSEYSSNLHPMSMNIRILSCTGSRKPI